VNRTISPSFTFNVPGKYAKSWMRISWVCGPGGGVGLGVVVGVGVCVGAWVGDGVGDGVGDDVVVCVGEGLGVGVFVDVGLGVGMRDGVGLAEADTCGDANGVGVGVPSGLAAFLLIKNAITPAARVTATAKSIFFAICRKCSMKRFDGAGNGAGLSTVANAPYQAPYCTHDPVRGKSRGSCHIRTSMGYQLMDMDL
jgi:hypothetical protein